MVLVVPHSGRVFDEVAHARGPQPGSKSECFGTTLERVFDPAQLGRAELGPAVRCVFLRKPRMPDCSSSRAQRLADRLPMHPHSGDLGLAESLFKVVAPPPSAALPARSEIPPHTRWITHALYISKIQNVCHYLPQDSIEA